MRILRNPATWIVGLWLLTFVALVAKTVPVSGDGTYYYSWLRSVVVDGDVDFRNELEHFRGNPHVARQLDSGVATPIGLTPNLFSAGPALLWAPFWLPVHWFSGGDGFRQGELRSTSVATGLYGLAGLLLAYGFVRRVLQRAGVRSAGRPAAVAVGAVLFATNLVYYLAIEASLAHGVGFFCVSLLLYLWWRWRDDLRAALPAHWWRWLVLGLAAGLAGSVRWQLLAVGLVVPGVDLAVSIYKQRSLSAVRNLALALVGAAAGFAPQLVGWHALYGSWLTVPQGLGFLDWRSPHFFEVLLSNRHGLLTWSPLAVLAIAGLVLACKRYVAARYALGVLIIQTYINGAAIEWWGGDAYGARRFTDMATVLVLGIALLLARTRRRWVRWLVGTAVALAVVANLLLMQAFRLDLISRSQPVHMVDLLQLLKGR